MHTNNVNGVNMNAINSTLFVCLAILAGHLIFPPLFHQPIYDEAVIPLSIIILICIVVQIPGIKRITSPIFTAEFYAKYTKGRKPPTKIEKEVNTIVKDARTPSAKFVELAIEIEKRTRLIADNLGIKKYAPISLLLSVLVSKEIIDSDSATLVRTFWRARNEVIHGERELSEDEFLKLVDMGEILLVKLERAYHQLKK